MQAVPALVDRWFQQHMGPRVEHEIHPLHEYTAPIKTRIFRKADALPSERASSSRLRNKYTILAATGISGPVQRLQPLLQPALLLFRARALMEAPSPMPRRGIR